MNFLDIIYTLIEMSMSNNVLCEGCIKILKEKRVIKYILGQKLLIKMSDWLS